MTQPDKPARARGARPQLFGESSTRRSSKSRHPDFEQSILATIDGGPTRRDARSGDAMPLKRVLWMSALALAVVPVYFSVKFGMLSGVSPAPGPASVVALQTPSAETRPVVIEAPKVQPTPEAPAEAGVASIENVAPPPAVAAASATAPALAPNVVTSLSNIQQALASSEKAESRMTDAKPVMMKDSRAGKGFAQPHEEPAAGSEATAGARPIAPPQKVVKRGNDSDAELIAAMLPHLKRRGLGPTSPAYERRCGQFVGDAAADCWAKFCNGREGVDAACPAAGR